MQGSTAEGPARGALQLEQQLVEPLHLPLPLGSRGGEPFEFNE